MSTHHFNLKCPHCKKSFMDAYKQIDGYPSIRLAVEIAGKSGIIRMSSVYGSYNYEANLECPVGESAIFKCPSCNEILNTEHNCPECGSPLVEFKVAEGGKAVICSKSGCKEHNVGYKDLTSTLHHFYKNHQYGDRTNH